MASLTDTEIHRITEFLQNNSCFFDSNLVKEHSKILSVLPAQFEQMLKNQEIIISKQDDVLGRLLVLETKNKSTVDRIEKLEDNQVTLFNMVNENRNQVYSILSARKVYLWVVNGIWALLVGLIFYLFDKGK